MTRAAKSWHNSRWQGPGNSQEAALSPGSRSADALVTRQPGVPGEARVRLLKKGRGGESHLEEPPMPTRVHRPDC